MDISQMFPAPAARFTHRNSRAMIRPQYIRYATIASSVRIFESNPKASDDAPNCLEITDR
jgi:hypothetical protein